MFQDQEFSPDLGSRAVNRISNVRTMRGLHPRRRQPDGASYPPDSGIEMNNFYTLTVYGVLRGSRLA